VFGSKPECEEEDIILPVLCYFDRDEAPSSDMLLGMSKMQGYVPDTCLLGGATVWNEVKQGRNPCAGCNGPREKCKGRPKT